MHQKVDGTVTKFVSATEQVPRKMNIPGLNRVVGGLICYNAVDLKSAYNWKTVKAQYFHNERKTVYYWALKMEKAQSPFK